MHAFIYTSTNTRSKQIRRLQWISGHAYITIAMHTIAHTNPISINLTKVFSSQLNPLTASHEYVVVLNLLY